MADDIIELKPGTLHSQTLLNDFNDSLRRLHNTVYSITNNTGNYAKTYTAFVTQVGTNAPTATTLQNNLGLINYTRLTVGTYTINSDGLFLLNRTLPLDDIWMDQNENVFLITYVDLNTLSLLTKNSDGDLADDILNRRAIYLLVY